MDSIKIIKEEDDPSFFRFVTDGNLLRQFDFLKTTVAVALRNPSFIVTPDLVRELNNYAVVHICETAGRYRRRGVSIKHSDHAPPHQDKVEGYMHEFFRYLAENWTKRSPTHLAAYALWRINWIHPFEEGNGRTARATSYLIHCVKLGMWLPGTNTIPKQIREYRKPYYDALHEADKGCDEKGRIDLGDLENYLDGLLAKQLSS